MALISIVTPCYNEEDNVDALYERIKAVFTETLTEHQYEHIFIDNSSTDSTVLRIKALCHRDPCVKLIVNARNFGHIRSPYYGLLQGRGDAVVSMASDLQDPPEVIVDFVRQWEQGYKLVLGIKKQEMGSRLMSSLRKFYYRLLAVLSDVAIAKDFTGFGLYDRVVVDQLAKLDDAYPYLRGIVSEFGYEAAKVEFIKPTRRGGISKNNFYTLYDMAMLGITNHSKVPLRLTTMLGFLLSAVSLLAASGFFLFKLLYWDNFAMGVAPIIIGLFFFSSVQLFCIGILGEYVGSIHTQILKRPLVIEKERVNFEQ